MTSAYDPSTVTAKDRELLRRCVNLAREALDAGDEPFGSLLVDDHDTVRFADRNRVAGGDATRHPEFAIARWAAAHLTPEQRRASTVYTSGEHCPMCSAAHAWVGLGRIVYAASTEQLTGWRKDWGFEPTGPVAPLPITVVAPGTPVAGPEPALTAEIRSLHARMLGIDTTD
ncbi:tRNA(Arg) A34 adenosine deaminase TadA [Haloactinopolyspora alba]|uniref:tRNA(Arg) A34 adenosine deaminase TadA n=1 Tax=Haloactinopolyspora alba TaxID=648780 RepID=A0A2P8EBI3_9ACTN|nr:nucleoside deaminase [Haloactinopolyspora alba]PSL06831.1 tRNA(Arg) A34 adenosine deaminase TadA [Haloactinopolyspora alba]